MFNIQLLNCRVGMRLKKKEEEGGSKWRHIATYFATTIAHSPHKVYCWLGTPSPNLQSHENSIAKCSETIPWSQHK